MGGKGVRLGAKHVSPDMSYVLYVVVLSIVYLLVDLMSVGDAKAINLIPEKFVAVHAAVARSPNSLAASVYHLCAVLLIFLPVHAAQVDEKKILDGSPVVVNFRRLLLLWLTVLALWIVISGNSNSIGISYAAWIGNGVGFFLASHLLGGGGLGLAIGGVMSLYRVFGRK